MARIRTIKPEFFTSEDIVAMTPLARLLYVALWCEADREGRLTWKPKTFKMRYFPEDQCDINALCQEVLERGLAVLFGEGFAYIPTFKVHQHINPRESQSTIADPHVATRKPRVSTRESTVSDAQVGREGREGSNSTEPDAGSVQASGFAIPLNDGSEYQVAAQALAEWAQSFPAVDVEQELREMRAWSNANKEKRKTKAGIDRFIVRWLQKAQDSPSRTKRSSGDWTGDAE
jgi:hypothetical protein